MWALLREGYILIVTINNHRVYSGGYDEFNYTYEKASETVYINQARIDR
jgi:hypothetical protein